MPDSSTTLVHLDEARRLRAIIKEFARIVGPGEWPRLPEPGGSLSVDCQLQEVTSAVRTRYLRGVAATTTLRWRTPPTGEAVPFLGTNESYSYAYDRQHPPRVLENRLIQNSTAGALLCSSGMAALNITIQGLAHMLHKPRRLVALASYFETLTLLRIGAFAGSWTRAVSETHLAELLVAGDVSVVLLETVRYDWSLATTDWSLVYDALGQLDNPPVILIDTTLSGDCQAQDQLLQRLRLLAPLVIRVRSGIKLDQLGFELANLGLVEWFLDSRVATHFARLGPILTACRVATGATLTWSDACALSPTFVLGSETLRKYSAEVFATNRVLNDNIPRQDRLFTAVIHPPPPWPAPFVLFKLRDGTDANYRWLGSLILQEQRRRGLKWQMSGSFGFRTARYETILPNEQLRFGEEPSGVLKIAAGRYPGAQLKGIIELMQELAGFADVNDVHRNWTRCQTSVKVP